MVFKNKSIAYVYSVRLQWFNVWNSNMKLWMHYHGHFFNVWQWWNPEWSQNQIDHWWDPEWSQTSGCWDADTKNSCKSDLWHIGPLQSRICCKGVNELFFGPMKYLTNPLYMKKSKSTPYDSLVIISCIQLLPLNISNETIKIFHNFQCISLFWILISEIPAKLYSSVWSIWYSINLSMQTKISGYFHHYRKQEENSGGIFEQGGRRGLCVGIKESTSKLWFVLHMNAHSLSWTLYQSNLEINSHSVHP